MKIRFIVGTVEMVIKSYTHRVLHASPIPENGKINEERLSTSIISIGHVAGNIIYSAGLRNAFPQRCLFGEMTDDRAACGALLLSCRNNQLARCVDTPNSLSTN